MLSHAARGTLLLLAATLRGASADASAYFASVSADERDVYDQWLSDRSATYARNAFLSSAESDEGAALFWKIDEETVHFAVAVRAEGWVGLGLSEAGGMTGADVALFEASKPSELVDAHVVDRKATPITDDCQDWTLEGALSEDGWTIVEMSRLLDTKDTQDHAIHDDRELWAPPTRIIAAWGDDDSVSYHGSNKARGSVRLFADHADELTEMEALLEVLEGTADDHFEVREEEFEIPQAETYYQEVCKTFDELGVEVADGQNGITMIGAVPIITKETEPYVHHFTVYLQADCTRAGFLTRSMLYAWAPGDEGWALPDDVGFPMFDDPNRQAIYVQTHYNNPDLVPDLKDSSGVRFYYSHDERTHEAGMLEVGDPFLSLNDEAVGEGYSRYEFTCPSQCSSFFLSKERSAGDGGVTILSEFLHMHQAGVRMTSEVLRNGEVINKAVSEVYDFDQQGAYHAPQEPYQFLPGDSFRTTCYYKDRDGTKFGLGSQDEMCINFIMYYPARKSVLGTPWVCPYAPFSDFGTGCSNELNISMLDGVDDLGRSFGDSGECAAVDGAPAPVPDPEPEPPSSSSAAPGEPVVVTVPEPGSEEAMSDAGSTAVSLALPTVALVLTVLFM